MKNNQARRVNFDKKERATALRLATAAVESQNAYRDYVDARLRARDLVTENAEWQYEPLAGVAVRVR
jgi:hypothetical protein